MGDNIRIMNTRVAALCFVAAVAVSVSAEGFDGVTPLRDLHAKQLHSEQQWTETTAFVQGFLSEKSNDETACAKIADTAIKAIEDECKALQTEIDKRANANGHCCDSGLSGINEAEEAHNESKGHHTKCLGEQKSVAQEKVDFGKISYEALSEDTCKQTFFNSAVYQAQHKKVSEKKTECVKLEGIKEGLKKGVEDATYAACISRGKCKSEAESERDLTFDNGHKACGSQKNKDAFTRAHHIKCVLAGTSLQGCNVPTAPSVKKTDMKKTECKLVCNMTNPVKGGTCNHGGHTGLRIIPNGCSGGKLALQTIVDNTWDKKKVYHCPPGWKWATTAEYFNTMQAHGCHSNNGKSQQNGGTAFSSKCGWSGYTPPGGGQSKYIFVFSDSAQTGNYQHAGNYVGYKDSNAPPSHFAGIGCIATH